MAAILARGLQHIMEPTHVDVPSRVRLLLRDSRKQCGEMIDRTDIVAADHFEDLLGLSTVEVFIAALRRKLEWRDAQIGSDDMLGAVAFS